MLGNINCELMQFAHLCAAPADIHDWQPPPASTYIAGHPPLSLDCGGIGRCTRVLSAWGLSYISIIPAGYLKGRNKQTGMCICSCQIAGILFYKRQGIGELLGCIRPQKGMAPCMLFHPSTLSMVEVLHGLLYNYTYMLSVIYFSLANIMVHKSRLSESMFVQV